MTQITYTVQDRVAVLRLNRPEKKNALSDPMYTALADGLARADGDSDVRAIVIGAEGNAFTAGNDLANFLSPPAFEGVQPVRLFMMALATAEKPVIAAVGGLAIGIGTTLLLHCDLVVASTGARFQTPFVDLGLVPEFASSRLMPAGFGLQRAAEILLLGESLDAETARTFGLVNRVVAAEDVDSTAMDLARRIANKPPEAVRQTKRLMREPREAVLRTIEVEGELFDRRLASPEAREAFSVFLAKGARKTEAPG